MSVSSAMVMALSTTETLTDSFITDADISFTGLNVSDTIDASSTVPATKCAYFRKTLSSGTATIDLTALTGANGASVTFNTLKVQRIIIKAPTGNGAAIAVTPGGSNGYNIFGASSSVTFAAGQKMLFDGNDALPDVGSSAKNITLTGTGSSDYLDIGLVAG